jgi:spore germination cell wall hydrolase CwlJ-like protein
MIRIFRRAGAVASVAVLCALFSGAGLTGANAQDQAEPEALEKVATPADDVNEDAQPRFVSQPVVQDIAEEAAPLADATSLAALVAELPVDNDLSPDLRCLAQAVYFEARGEPLDGQLAVARVVINRAASSLFPDDYCSVVTQRSQFSFVRGGNIPEPRRNSAAWARAKAIARIAHRDLWNSAAGDSLYFHASSVKPRWARSKATLARIDSHIFYR